MIFKIITFPCIWSFTKVGLKTVILIEIDELRSNSKWAWVSLHINALEKDTNFSLLPPAIDKYCRLGSLALSAHPSLL